MKIKSGDTLASLRKKQRYTQQYIADYLMVSRPTYERYEKDAVEIPLSRLCDLAFLYKIEPLDLLAMIVPTQLTFKISYNDSELMHPKTGT